MLTQLTVNNFAIVKFLELDLQPGMTCITGETGGQPSPSMLWGCAWGARRSQHGAPGQRQDRGECPLPAGG